MLNISCNLSGATIILQVMMSQSTTNAMQELSGIGLKLISTAIEYMLNVYQTTNLNQWNGQLVKMVSFEEYIVESFILDLTQI